MELVRRTSPAASQAKLADLQPLVTELNAMLFALRASLRARAKADNQR